MTDAPPTTAAARQRRYRRRDKLGLLLATAEVPPRLAERLVEVGLVRQQDAADARALGAALIKASERLIEKLP